MATEIVTRGKSASWYHVFFPSLTHKGQERRDISFLAASQKFYIKKWIERIIGYWWQFFLSWMKGCIWPSLFTKNCDTEPHTGPDYPYFLDTTVSLDLIREFSIPTWAQDLMLIVAGSLMMGALRHCLELLTPSPPVIPFATSGYNPSLLFGLSTIFPLGDPRPWEGSLGVIIIYEII